ncbi:hypothetical protein ACFVQB_14785 [Paenibacillus sp. NPDC057886]|uniref:hypothetical protein n=1 Tax=Paenibacillus sp. NPDC057886 TaxID=3346270 RepID=UPI00367A5BA8
MLGLLIKKKLENSGRSIAWLADKLDINEKTLAGKLKRESISGEEILVITTILGIDIRELQKEVYKKRFDTGGNFMNGEKIINLLEAFRKDGCVFTKKQINYIKNYHEMDGEHIKWMFNKDQQEVFFWSDKSSFDSFADSEFYLGKDESFIFIEFENEVIWGYKEYESSLRFFEMLETIESDDEVSEDGEHIWDDED